MQFIDLQAQYQHLKTEIDANIANVLNTSKFISGPEVAEFENALSEYIGRKHCVSCANGTDALQMVYMAYGIGAGDAVFCPDVTFIASVEPACMLGATPVFCDIDADTYNIDVDSLERQIKAVIAEGKYRPRAVVGVDFLGNPCDWDKLTALCKKYELILLEDAAQATGAVYHGRRCGSFGDIAITSFFPAKPLGCYGDGGAVYTDDANMAELLRSIRVHGKGPKGKYDNVRVGVNSRLDTLQAAIMMPKLKALEEYEMEARQRVVARYNDAFKDGYVTPYVLPEALSVYAQYALLAPDVAARNAMISHLDECKIPNMIYYPTPQHMLDVFAGAPIYGESFVNAMNYCSRTFSLPMHPYLDNAEQMQIIEAVKSL